MSDQSAEKSWRARHQNGEPPPHVQIPDGGPCWEEPPPQRRFVLAPFSEIEWVTTGEYLVKDILPVVGLVLVYGPPKCGKSFWAFDLAMHVAMGIAYRGKRVRQGGVVYLAAEGGTGFKKRVKAYKLKNDCTGALFHLCTIRPDLAADAPALIADIRAQLGTVRPAAIVVDTVNRTLVGSENKPDDMARYLRAAASIEDEFKCCVVLIHHCGLEQGRPRGHTSLTAAADVQIAVVKAGDNVLTTVELMKDGPSGETLASKLEQVEIGSDDDGEKVTSCIIVPTDPVTQAENSPKLTANQRTMFGMLHAAGKAGLMTEEWNEMARSTGIGVRRRADLIDIRNALKAKKLVREFADRWTVNHRS